MSQTEPRARRAIVFLTVLLTGAAAHAESRGDRTVVLLHGLARTSGSMKRMATSLEAAGYRVCNIDYPSRKHSIATLAAEHVAPSIAKCTVDPDQPLDFVTHSLGGIVLRQLVATDSIPKVGRVVMLGPPNRGSEVVDKLGSLYPFETLNGPAGRELGTSATSLPNTLGRATFAVGIIAGRRSINWILSSMIPGTDDGKVSIDRAKLEGMQDFISVPVSHPFLMTDRHVIEQTLSFLEDGRFTREP